MPKVVDWNKRRDEVLAATWRVISRDGLANASIRAIAREAGYSPGVLSHYFTGKDDIIASAMVHSHRRVVERIDQATARLRGLAALRALMLEVLPLDEERLLEARLEIGFWGRTLADPRLTRLQNAEFDRFWQRLRLLLDDARDLGELRPNLDLDELTHQLVVLMDGLSVQSVLYTKRVPAKRQIALLDALLDSARAPLSKAAAAP